MTDADREWKRKDRTAWWLKTLGLAATIATVALAANKWILTRASIEYVDNRIETREPKENARAVENRLEAKVDKHQEILTNVRDNLIILLDRQRIEPKPLPRDVP